MTSPAANFGWLTDPTQMDPTTSLGLALLANSNTPGGFGSIFGKSLQQSQANAQNSKLTQQQIQQNNLALQNAQQNQAFMQRLTADAERKAQLAQGQPQGLMGPDSDQTQAANTTDQFRPGVSPMPAQQPFGWSLQGQQGQPQTAQPQQQSPPQQGLPSWLTPLSPDQIGNISVGGLSGPMATVAAMRLQNKDAATAQKETLAQQYETAQRTLGPKLQSMDYLIKSDKPTQYMQADKELMAAWPALAKQAGIDPSEYTDDNVRRALAVARNGVATSIGLPATPVPNKLITKGNQQLDPVTGKVEHEENLEDVDLGNGQHALLPQSQAVGKPKFNATTAAAGNVSDQAIQMAADTYRTTGKMPASFGRSPALQAKILDRVASDAAAAGDSAGAIAARASSLKANGQALDQVTKLESSTTTAAQTLEKNLASLQQIGKSVDSSGVPLLNKAYRYYQQGVSGSPDVAKYVTMLNAVEGEYAKISSGNLGNAPVTDAAKRDAKDVINKYMTTGQIDAVADTMRQEAQNRLSAIREQKQSLTGQLSQNAPGKGGSGAQVSPTSSSGSTSSGKAPVRVSSPQEALALAPGTVFITPDGRTKVR